jgi:hypothetical protein
MKAIYEILRNAAYGSENIGAIDEKDLERLLKLADELDECGIFGLGEIKEIYQERKFLENEYLDNQDN